MDNLSDHVPILLKINCANINIDTAIPAEAPSFKPTPLWQKATNDQLEKYKSDLNRNINNISVPSDAVCCRNVHCRGHWEELDSVAEDLLAAISQAVQDNIPHSRAGTKASQCVPGWKEKVAPYLESAQFWRFIWEADGCREGTQAHKVMQRTRAQYRYAVRRTKRQDAQLRKSSYVQACLDGKVSDILSDIKKSRAKNKSCAQTIDGFSGLDEIADNFKNIYCEIYNTHKSKDELDSFIESNNNMIKQQDVNLVDKITPQLVSKTIKKMKNSKNDSEVDWKSDALKIGVDSLAEPLCDVLKTFIVHGYIPKVFLSIALIPIVKDNNSSKLTSKNYRLIAISSLLLKLFDTVFLELYQDVLCPSPHQFGFQKGLSTTMCSWAVMETVNFFRNRGSSVFVCLLDLSKAFDLVILPDLFKKLSEKVPALFIRFIIFSYINQECRVRWRGQTSSSFSIGNGVRQGAVASPVFFNLYIDGLFTILQNSGYGCYIGEIFHGAYSYADDITLLSPTRQGLQYLIDTCEKFFTRHGITISTDPIPEKSKTKCLLFGNIAGAVPVRLYNRDIPYVQQAKLLGNQINIDESSSHDLEKKTCDLRSGYFTLLQEMGDQAPEVYITLIRTYLLHLYGAPLWDIFDDSSNKLWVAWHKIVKQLFDLPYATHINIMTALSGVDHIQLTVIKRFSSFYNKLRDSKNRLIRNLFLHQHRDARSCFGKNCIQLRESTRSQEFSENINMINIHRLPKDEEWKVYMVKDILRSLKRTDTLLSEDELKEMLQSICCD